MGNAPLKEESVPESLSEFRSRYSGNQILHSSQASLDEGICHGMCLDWVRLMLHGRGIILQNYKTMAPEHHKRQEILHSMFKRVTDETVKRNTMKADKHNHWVAARREELIELSKKDMPAANKKAAEIEPELLSRRKKLAALKNEDIYPVSFARFKAEFKEKFTNDEADFSGFDVQPSSDKTIPPPDLDLLNFLAAVKTMLSQLQPGYAAILQMNGETGGHAFAFARVNQQYNLFDPNAGWYFANDEEKATKMFADLYRAVYAVKKYTSMRFRIFRRSAAATPAGSTTTTSSAHSQ